MKLQQILNIIKKQDWWREETPCVHQIAEWAWKGFCESSKHFHKDYLSTGIFIYRKDHGYEHTPQDEKIEQFRYLVRELRKDKQYLNKIRVRWLKIAKPMKKNAWKLLSEADKLSREKLAKQYKLVTSGYVKQARFSVFMECVDPYTEYELPKILLKKLPDISQKERNKIAYMMSSPDKLSFMEVERLDLFKSCLRVSQKKSKLSEEADKLEKKYIWMTSHYGAAIDKTSNQFKKEMQRIINKNSAKKIKSLIENIENLEDDLKKKKQKLIKRYGIDEDLQHIFSAISQTGSLIDERKTFSLPLTHILYKLFDILEKRLGVNARLLGYTTYDELYEWLKSDKRAVPLKTLKERRRLSVYVTKLKSPGKSEYEFITGNPAEAIFEAFFPKIDVKEFHGTVASSNNEKIRGKVSVVLNVSKDKFTEGNILVTTMTRPEFVPLMRKAKAIITDEGGLTCHAAIISRELKLPCIIGTKIATKVLKDGDKIEVNANKGVVKIIK